MKHLKHLGWFLAHSFSFYEGSPLFRRLYETLYTAVKATWLARND